MCMQKTSTENLSINYSEYIDKQGNLIEDNKLFKLFIEQGPTAIAIVNRQMRYLFANQQWLTIHNIDKDNIVGISHYELFPEHSLNLTRIYQECLLGSRKTYQEYICNQQRNTCLKWNFSPWYEANQTIGGIIIHAFNQEKIIEPFFDLSVDMLCCITTDGYFKDINLAFQEILGYCETELIQKPMLSFIHPEDRTATLESIETLSRGLVTTIQFENRCRCQNDSYKWLQWKVDVVGKRKLLYAVVTDITKSRQLSDQLSWQTQHDVLTGIYNRYGFEQEVSKAISLAQKNSQHHVFCYLDIDRFKVINDICGHLAGDELLRQVTNILQQRLRSNDILARIGNDEFGILLKQCSLKQAENIAQTLSNLIHEFRFTWENKSFSVGVSIGIIAIEQNNSNFSDILNAGDTACHAAKQKNSNRIQVYRLDDQELIKQRGERHWISRINLALEEDRFRLYCQKISPLQDKFGIEHYEILLRLLDEEGKLVTPTDFIPAAERYNLMPAIDRWVIKTFFTIYQRDCQNKCHAKCRAIYTINLSGASINDHSFFDFLKEQLLKYQIVPEKICFEITETAAIANLATAAKFINELKELGCSFALDDFGSGMSSLAYLKNLPVDYLKIDGNFVKNIVNDPIDRATVECFNRIGQVMNIRTIAEFVENEDIISQLKELGVDYAQGYGISEPCPLEFS